VGVFSSQSILLCVFVCIIVDEFIAAKFSCKSMLLYFVIRHNRCYAYMMSWKIAKIAKFVIRMGKIFAFLVDLFPLHM